MAIVVIDASALAEVVARTERAAGVARRNGCPLLTMDRRLIRAPRLGVALRIPGRRNDTGGS